MSTPTPIGDVVERRTQVIRAVTRGWILTRGIEATDDLVAVLGRCESAAEVWFGSEFARRVDVRPDPASGSVVGDGITVRIQVAIRTSRADFTIERGRARLAVDVDAVMSERRTPEEIDAACLRQRRFVAAGYAAVRFTAREVFRDPAECWRQTLTIIEAMDR